MILYRIFHEEERYLHLEVLEKGSIYIKKCMAVNTADE